MTIRIHGTISELASDDAFRILVLGDSFTFGYGVENDETYSVQLQNLLNERLDRTVEVVNAGFASPPKKLVPSLLERG